MTYLVNVDIVGTETHTDGVAIAEDGRILVGSLGLRDTLDEVLRYRSPVINANRWATEDTELVFVNLHGRQWNQMYPPSRQIQLG